MTLLPRMLVDLAVEAAAWIGLLSIVALAVALPASLALRGRAPRHRILIGAFAGGSVAAALAHRFGAPDPLAVSVWRRDLLVVWALIGAAVGVAAALRWAPQGPESATPVDGIGPR